VPILNDGKHEPTETFLLILSKPVNCKITDGTGVATIKDDD
jgi:hypothetical protein